MTVVDLDEVRLRVTKRAGGWDDEEVAVRVEQTAGHPLHVTISSKHPSTYYN